MTELGLQTFSIFVVKNRDFRGFFILKPRALAILLQILYKICKILYNEKEIMKKFILASGSPRRKDILLREGYDFDIVTSDKEDVFDKTCSADKFSVRCAISKARDVYSRSDKSSVVLGADTVVALGGEILGKPKDITEAEEMLRRLSGKTHAVTTGYAVYTENFFQTGSVTTEVEFENLTDEGINAYLKSGLWQGKAGAYGIQDGFPLVKSFKGDRDNVVGLPIAEIKPVIDLLLGAEK